ncbi:MAG: response regulator [Candidatus Velthaea sp.]
MDDDESVRGAIHGALASVGLQARLFGSAEDFLDSELHSDIACLISDIELPGMSGLELQIKLAESGWRVPIIFITAFGDPMMRAQAMRAGATEFLEKPFDGDFLLDTVRAVLGT